MPKTSIHIKYILYSILQNEFSELQHRNLQGGIVHLNYRHNLTSSLKNNNKSFQFLRDAVLTQCLRTELGMTYLDLVTCTKRSRIGKICCYLSIQNPNWYRS